MSTLMSPNKKEFHMREIKREPLGIRKLDVQALRRQARRDHKVKAQRTYDHWFASRDQMPLTEENLVRFAEVMLSVGWEKGVTDGAKATRDRVAESLKNGRLKKTR